LEDDRVGGSGIGGDIGSGKEQGDISGVGGQDGGEDLNDCVGYSGESWL
jgi:hypothetical protein